MINLYQYNFFDVLLRKLCYLMRSRLIFVCLYQKEYIYTYIHITYTHTRAHTHAPKYFDFKNMVIIKLFIFYKKLFIIY